MLFSRFFPTQALLGFALLCSLTCQSLNAEILRLAPVAEGYIRSTQTADETKNVGNSLVLVGDTARQDDFMRAVVTFNLSQPELEGATLTGASLSLQVMNRDSAGGGSVSSIQKLQIHALDEVFDEQSVDWAHAASGKAWSLAGGDFGECLATLEVNPPDLRTGDRLKITGEKLASELVGSMGQTFSLILKLEDEDQERSVLRLLADKFQLELEYTPSPEVAAAMAKLRGPLTGQPEVPVANVVPVPGHPEAHGSALYGLYVGGHPIEVKDEAFDFDVAMFTMGDAPVLVDIMVMDHFEKFSLKPDRHGLQVERIHNALRFTLEEPHKLVLQIPGRKPLAIIATPLETEVPSPSDPNVVYFAPGVTRAGVIRPESGQTLYFAPGALVKGRIEARDVTNVKVLGRGLLETAGYAIRDKKLHGILFDRSENIFVEGIGVRSDDTWWQTLFLNTINAEVAQVNLFGIGVNTDGVDIDAVKNFLVRDSFIRCEDDGLGWHSLDAAVNGEMITEDAVADNLVIWNTRAGNGIRIGASMEAQLWRNITIRNVDILMHDGSGIMSDYSDWAWMDNLRFENVTIEKPSSPIYFFISETRYSNSNGYLTQRGHMHGVLFENFTMNGGRISLTGAGERNRINDVYFNNCTNAGKLVDSPKDIKTNKYVTNIHFNEDFQPIDRESLPGVYEVEDYESKIHGGVQYLADNPEASMGRHRVFIPKEEGAYIEHFIPVPSAGDYRLTLLVRASAGEPRAMLTVNGGLVLDNVDLQSDGDAFKVLSCGNIHIEKAGLQEIRLTLQDEHGNEELRIEWDAIQLKAK